MESDRCLGPQWFKLHLHPAAMEPPQYDMIPGSAVAGAFKIPPLPRNVSVEQAYSDFIAYLFDNTKVCGLGGFWNFFNR